MNLLFEDVVFICARINLTECLTFFRGHLNTNVCPSVSRDSTPHRPFQDILRLASSQFMPNNLTHVFFCSSLSGFSFKVTFAKTHLPYFVNQSIKPYDLHNCFVK